MRQILAAMTVLGVGLLAVVVVRELMSGNVLRLLVALLVPALIGMVLHLRR